MTMPGWDRLSREQKVAALARADGPLRECPACGRQVHVLRGYFSQHTDPASWSAQPRQCVRELTPADAAPQARTATGGEADPGGQND